MSNISPTIPNLNKEVSKRDFLKIVAGFLAFFSFGGFASLISSKLNPSKDLSTPSYGSRPYGM